MGEFDLCYLFATCDSYQDCPACVTGDEQCWQTLGGDCSLAPTPAPTLSPTTVTTTMTTAECPEGWMWNPDFGKCYYVIDDGDGDIDRFISWNEANERCAALDPDNKATLTSVQSQEENNYILSLTDDAPWIGGNDKDEEGVWRWAEDGSLVDDGSGSYTNWFPNHPLPNPYQNCMVMYYLYDGTWADYACDSAFYAVCSKPITTA